MMIWIYFPGANAGCSRTARVVPISGPRFNPLLSRGASVSVSGQPSVQELRHNVWITIN
jgi:hypothetical protein